MQVSALLGQALGQRLPILAAVPAAINPEFGFGDVPQTSPHIGAMYLILRQHVEGIWVLGMDTQHKTKSGRQTLRNVPPVLAAVVAAVNTAVVLLVQRVESRRVSQHFVGALTELGQGVRREVGPHAAVAKVPTLTAVFRAKHAHGRHSNPHPVWILRVENHAVQAQSSQPKLPLGSGRVLGESSHLLPVVSPILGLEKRRWFGAGENHTQLRRKACLDVPQLAYRGSGLSSVSRYSGKPGRPFSLFPGLPQVIGNSICGPHIM